MVAPYLVACGLLLLGSLLARLLPVARRSFDTDHEDGWDLDARGLAYLRAGRYGVVLTVLAELHGEGAVAVPRRGRVRRLDPPHDLHDALTVAVYSGLRWTRRPRLLALLPGVRRACAPLRWELLDRSLLAPRRRMLFAGGLRAYALGLAAAMVIEDDYRGSTMLAALGVGVAAALTRGPSRTVAGFRELALHRAALGREAGHGWGEAAYLTDIVAAHGVAALRVLCADYVPSGALAPPAPSYEPPARPSAPVVPVATPAPAPRRPVPRFEVFVPAEPPEPAVLRPRVRRAA